MTFYLRNNKKQTLVDIEISIKDQFITDISSVVAIEPYSELLLEQDDKYEVIFDFTFLSDLRGWFFEGMYDEDEYSSVIKCLKDILSDICGKYDLFIYQD